MSNIETIKEKVNQAEDLARKIWLAGIGAYGKGFDEAQGQYEKLNTEATKLFNELVLLGLPFLEIVNFPWESTGFPPFET